MSKPARRRLSAGCITASPLSTSAHSDGQLSDLSFLRRHSSAPFSCSGGSESRAIRESLRSIVVTPASIPQFRIPKLAVQETHRETQPAGKLTEDLTDPLHLSSSSVPKEKAQRSISDPADNCRRTSVRCFPRTLMESGQCSDPATRGALSLPHMAKITTPYGFVTLSQSPQMANEEELLLQSGYRSWARDQKNKPLKNLRVETNSSSSGRTLTVQRLTNTDSHHVSRGISNSDPHICSDSFPSPDTASRPKQSFWGVLHKSLYSQKLAKCI